MNLPVGYRGYNSFNPITYDSENLGGGLKEKNVVDPRTYSEKKKMWCRRLNAPDTVRLLESQ